MTERERSVSTARWATTREAAVVLALALLVGCKAPPVRLALPKPVSLPSQVVFRTPSESFNQHYLVALRDGRIWVKARKAPDKGPAPEWHLLGQTGLPEGDDLVRFPAPKRVIELSADGLHLQAVSEAGVFYRGDNLTSAKHVEGWFNWSDRWGWPAARGPGLKTEWPLRRGWSVSDSHPLGVGHYQDPNGTRHRVGLGVAHVYRLSQDGHRIHFNDWWLPADWSRQVCGPERGTLEMVNLSASASTLMVVGAGGELYTRLYDFDTAGENDLLTYSYIIDGPDGTTRKLPAEPWRRQPQPAGRITPRITIFRNGKGNAKRVLRVEGMQAERLGYFEKDLLAEDWRFVPLDGSLSGELLPGPERPVEQRGEGAPPGGDSGPASPHDRAYSGTVTRDKLSVAIELLDFNLFCSPARAHLLVDGAPVLAGGEPLELALHHVHTLVKKKRSSEYWKAGEAASVKAALLLPANWSVVDDAEVRARLAKLFGKRRVVNTLGSATLEALELKEIPWTTPFRVPAREKPMGSRVRLELQARP